MIVVDTHVFLWYAVDDANLDPTLKEAMRGHPLEVLVPSICLWEAMMLAEKGRIRVEGEDVGVALRRYVGLFGFQVAPLTAEIALLSRELPFEHDDPADRFIAATAHALSAELATANVRLRKLPWVKLAY